MFFEMLAAEFSCFSCRCITSLWEKKEKENKKTPAD